MQETLEKENARLKKALEQALDDMGDSGTCVCLATKLLMQCAYFGVDYSEDSLLKTIDYNYLDKFSENASLLTERACRSKEEAIRLLVSEGIMEPNGNLSKKYKD